MASQVLHGSRAKVFIGPKLVGIFSSITWGVQLVSRDIDIVGAEATQEIQVTGYAPVEISATGYRIMKNGPFSDSIRMGKLQDLLTLNDITVTIHDRLSNTPLAVIVGVKVLGFNNTVAAKQTTEIQFTMRGLVLSDEEGSQGESTTGPQGAAQLP
jgi:hypothetical protein